MFGILKYILILFLFHQRDKIVVYGIGKQYLGCYVDQPTRTLPYERLNSNAMTNDMCASHCCSVLSDATFMGTELRKECYCSNAPNNDSFVKSPSECNSPCGGNSNEICGDMYRLSLYSLDCSPETIVPSVSKVTTESTLHCLQINNTVWTEEELAEKLYLLRNAISIDKKETKLYRATKMSAYDPRKSSRNIGIVGVIVLVVPVIFVVVIDVHRICQ